MGLKGKKKERNSRRRSDVEDDLGPRRKWLKNLGKAPEVGRPGDGRGAKKNSSRRKGKHHGIVDSHRKEWPLLKNGLLTVKTRKIEKRTAGTIGEQGGQRILAYIAALLVETESCGGGEWGKTRGLPRKWQFQTGERKGSSKKI